METEDNHNKNGDEQAVEDLELGAILNKADIDSVFTTPQSTDNIKFMMTPGSEDPKELYMRADLPNKRLAVAFVLDEEECVQHAHTAGVRKRLKLIAALTGVGGKRIETVSETIIGEKRRSNLRRGIGDWVREKAGMGGPE